MRTAFVALGLAVRWLSLLTMLIMLVLLCNLLRSVYVDLGCKWSPWMAHCYRTSAEQFSVVFLAAFGWHVLSRASFHYLGKQEEWRESFARVNGWFALVKLRKQTS